MSSRVYFEVKWKASEWLWYVRRRDISGGVLAFAKNKAEAVKKARAEARAYVATGGKAELVIYREDGAIAKGRGSRSSYPRDSDPRRRKG